MVKNIYKSYITTIFGVLFLVAGVAYPFVVKDATREIIVPMLAAGGILIFSSDAQIKRIIDRITK
jgi:K+-transporting ATPase c subunit